MGGVGGSEKGGAHPRKEAGIKREEKGEGGGEKCGGRETDSLYADKGL